VKRKLLFANVALLALSAAIIVHLRRSYVETRAREKGVLSQHIRPIPPPPTTPRPAPEPMRPAAYSDIAQKMLFAKDRNPVVVVEPPPPPPKPKMPALPVFHGVINMGDGPIAILSEGPKAPHRDYQPGDQVGAFKLVSVNSDELVLEWEGQTITKKVDEMIDRNEPATPAASAAPVEPAAPPPAPVATAAAKPGLELPTGIRACVSGDTSPEGTVADGMRKVIKPTPFGSRCYWESDSGK